MIVVNLHGAISERAKDCDDRNFPEGHITHMLQILIPLLFVHAVELCGSSDHLERKRVT